MTKDYTPAVLETPYAGDIENNMKYLDECQHDMLLNHHEAPYASHALYTRPGVLDDSIPEEREAGILAGFAWKHLEGVKTVFYIDLGLSSGMQKALKYCVEHGMDYEIRALRGVMQDE